MMNTFSRHIIFRIFSFNLKLSTIKVNLYFPPPCYVRREASAQSRKWSVCTQSIKVPVKKNHHDVPAPKHISLPLMSFLAPNGPEAASTPFELQGLLFPKSGRGHLLEKEVMWHQNPSKEMFGLFQLGPYFSKDYVQLLTQASLEHLGILREIFISSCDQCISI